MREKLKLIDGERREFIGTFVRFGTKTGFRGYQKTTVLLQDIECTSNKSICAEHLWFNLTKEFAKVDLQEGDLLSFKARVKEYYKGYKGYREDVQWEKPIEKDYKLSHPTKIILLKRKEAITQLELKGLVSLDQFL